LGITEELCYHLRATVQQ